MKEHNPTDLASSGVWENVMLCKIPTFDGVCGILFFIILLAHLFAITVQTCWHSCQCVAIMADGIANFFLAGCNRCYCHSNWKPLRCYNGRCFCQCGYLWPFCEMADGIVIVADGIATFLFMTDVIVIVEME